MVMETSYYRSLDRIINLVKIAGYLKLETVTEQ